MTVLNAAYDDAAEITIDGSIGESWYDPSGVSSRTFNNELNQIPRGRQVIVKINSPGGAVGDALAIYNAMQERKDDVTCCVTGYALSSASLIALGGGRTIAPKSSIMMIHPPLTEARGNAADFEKAKRMLETHGDTIAGVYAAKTGKSVEEINQMMEKETWLTGEEALEMGFADAHSMDDDGDLDEEAENEAKKKVGTLASFDLSKYKMPPHVLNMIKPISAADDDSGDAGMPPVKTNQTEEKDPNMGKETEKTGAAATSASQTQTPPAAAAAAPAAAAGTVTISSNELADIRAAVMRERTARVQQRLNGFVTECRLAKDELPDALARSLVDESYLEVVAKRAPMLIGGAPLPGGGYAASGSIEIFDDVFRQIKSEKSVLVRNQRRSSDWTGLMAHARSMDARGAGLKGVSDFTSLPVNANSLASALVVDTLSDMTITQLVAVLPALRAFTTNFEANPAGPLSTVQVRLVTQGGTQQKATKANVSATGAITNYEQGDHTVAAVPVTMSEYSEAINLTWQELNSYARISHFANHALSTLGKNIVTDTLQVFSSSTFTAGLAANGTIQAHPGTWTWNVSGGTDMSTLRAAIGASSLKYALLNPAFFSKLITIPIASNNAVQLGVGLSSPNTFANVMGWNEICENSAWPNGTGNETTIGQICGIGLNPQAVAVAARLPIMPPEGIPGNTLVQSTVLIPGLDLTVALFQWFNLQTRTLWHSFGVVYGAAAGDLTSAAVLKTLA
jgi:ATP-dependent Clp endopeptidase proteolytic subunit ClpP